MIKNHKKTKLAFIAGATTLAALAPPAHAQSSDALIDKLVDKGILTVNEAKDLRDDADKDYKTAFQAKTGMPDWVTGYKIGGDFRGRFDEMTTGNPGMPSTAPTPTTGMDRLRFRYRLRFGITVNMQDNLEAGFRLGSGDVKGNGGTPLSANTTLSQDFTKKPIYIDAAYGKWTALNAGPWMLSTTIGKMDSPFKVTPMILDPDITPEGAALQAGYSFNDNQSLAFNSGAFVLNDSYLASPSSTVTGSSEIPFMYCAQLLWNAKWSDKWSTTLGGGAFATVNNQNLSINDIGYSLATQGNTRDAFGNLVYNYTPLIADASVTYTADTFPFYTGTFPITASVEFMDNTSAPRANNGYWAGITFGKSGTKHTWDLTYRYEYLGADAWYDQLVDDDNIGYYLNKPLAANGSSTVSGSAVGYQGGTNIKGHYVRLNYSVTDSVTLAVSCYINSLINSQHGNDPQNSAMHFMVDAMWKF